MVQWLCCVFTRVIQCILVHPSFFGNVQWNYYVSIYVNNNLKQSHACTMVLPSDAITVTVYPQCFSVKVVCVWFLCGLTWCVCGCDHRLWLTGLNIGQTPVESCGTWQRLDTTNSLSRWLLFWHIRCDDSSGDDPLFIAQTEPNYFIRCIKLQRQVKTTVCDGYGVLL